MALSAAQKDRYDRDGFLILEGLVSRAQVDALLRRLDQIVGETASRPAGVRLQVEPAIAGGEAAAATYADSLRKAEGLVEHDELFAGLARSPELLGIFTDILGRDLKLFRDALMMKPPRHGSAKPYHQDSAYWQIDPPALASCWLALDEATLENGCMRVLCGSHRWGLQEHRHLSDYQVVEDTLDRSGEVTVPLRPGGCLIFHSLLLHATSPNHSPHPRRALILSVMSARSCWTGDPARKPCFPLLSGREYPGCV
jgi:phytanoyl-CoA hydroxylase